MKKFILTAIVAIASFATASAYTLDSPITEFKGDGVTLNMRSDGYFNVYDSQTNTALQGTYDIVSHRRVEPGCSQVDVTFTVNGETIYGQLFWPTEQGLMINFDNIILKKTI